MCACINISRVQNKKQAKALVFSLERRANLKNLRDAL